MGGVWVWVWGVGVGCGCGYGVWGVGVGMGCGCGVWVGCGYVGHHCVHMHITCQVIHANVLCYVQVYAPGSHKGHSDRVVSLHTCTL